MLLYLTQRGCHNLSIFQCYDIVHKSWKTSSAERNSGRKPILSEKDRHTLKRTAAQVTAELNIHLEDRVSPKRARR